MLAKGLTSLGYISLHEYTYKDTIVQPEKIVKQANA